MKIAIVNTYANGGGAARAANRLYHGLRQLGHESFMYVLHGSGKSVVPYQPEMTLMGKVVREIRSKIIDRSFSQYVQSRPSGLKTFSDDRSQFGSGPIENIPDCDVVNLHWGAGLIDHASLPILVRTPMVWTLHDMWPFTGGCHYDDECGRFKQACGRCPILSSQAENDLSHKIWERKQKSWSEVPIAVVAPSHWLAEMARASSLFKNRRVEVIPNGIDTEKYKPLDKKLARDAYGLPQDRKLVLFSAMSATTDKRKGHHLLLPALKKMALEGWGKKTELIIIGASEPDSAPALDMKVHYMGHLHDEISSALLFSAADVTVAPSMQENLSNTVMESLSCGTPVVAFNIGGMPDMIDHQSNGYLASAFESDDLAQGIMWILESDERQEMLSRQARKIVLERFAIKTVANQYLTLYQDLLK